MFFNKGDEFNQGDMFTLSESAVGESYQKSLDFFKTCSKVDRQQRGISLQSKFSVSNTVEKLLEWVG